MEYVGTETLCELNCKLDAILEQNRRLAGVREPAGRMDKNLEKLEAQLGRN